MIKSHYFKEQAIQLSVGRGQEKTTEVKAMTVPMGQGSAVPPTALTTRV